MGNWRSFNGWNDVEPKRLAWYWRMHSLGSAHVDSKPHVRVCRGNARQAVAQFEWDNIPKWVQKTSTSMMPSPCCFYILPLDSVRARVVLHLHTFLSTGWYIPHFADRSVCTHRGTRFIKLSLNCYQTFATAVWASVLITISISRYPDCEVSVELSGVDSLFAVEQQLGIVSGWHHRDSLSPCLHELRSLFRSSPVMKCCNLLSRCSFLPLAGLVYFLFTKWLPTQNAF